MAQVGAAEAPPARLTSVPPCADDLVAVLDGGTRVEFDGADRADPLSCRVKLNGAVFRNLAGFWRTGRNKTPTAAERRAVQAALTGPAGTRAEFEDKRATLWGRVVIEHVADPVLMVAGRPRQTVLLRAVKHDAHGRAQVQVETLAWVDVETGIPLKRQAVTRLADGRRQAATTWQVERLTLLGG